MHSLSKTLAVLGLCLAFSFPALAADMLKAGDAAPTFTLKDQADKDISLEVFKGKWVVLYFYPKDQTPGCSLEAHNFQRDILKYTEKNTEVMGVSVDSPASHRDFCKAQELTFTLLADEKTEVTALYGSLINLGVTALAARNTFLIDPEGIIRKVYTEVSPATHSDDVLADITVLQADKKE